MVEILRIVAYVLGWLLALIVGIGGGLVVVLGLGLPERLQIGGILVVLGCALVGYGIATNGIARRINSLPPFSRNPPVPVNYTVPSKTHLAAIGIAGGLSVGLGAGVAYVLATAVAMAISNARHGVPLSSEVVAVVRSQWQVSAAVAGLAAFAGYGLALNRESHRIIAKRKADDYAATHNV